MTDFTQVSVIAFGIVDRDIEWVNREPIIEAIEGAFLDLDIAADFERSSVVRGEIK